MTSSKENLETGPFIDQEYGNEYVNGGKTGFPQGR